jgi:hypothetical protein
VPEHRPALSGAFLWIGVLLFIVYPLSLGPAVLLARNHPATGPALSVIYAPLLGLIENSPPVKKFFDAYMRSWAPL